MTRAEDFMLSAWSVPFPGTVGFWIGDVTLKEYMW